MPESVWRWPVLAGLLLVMVSTGAAHATALSLVHHNPRRLAVAAILTAAIVLIIRALEAFRRRRNDAAPA